MSGRRRSSSFGVKSPENNVHADATSLFSLEALEATHQLWELVCLAMEDPLSKQTLLHSSCNVCLIKTLLDRAHQLDHFTRAHVKSSFTTTTTATTNSNSNNKNSSANLQVSLPSSSSSFHWLSTMLRQGDGESGYTPLHRAVLKSELPVILMLLHYAVAIAGHGQDDDDEWTCALSKRLMHRPLALLQGDIPSLPEEVRSVLQTTDREGLTAYQLMEKLQIRELEQCRKSLVLQHQPTLAPDGTRVILDNNGIAAGGGGNGNNHSRTRHHSFEAMLQQDHEQQLAAEQNEFAHLHDYVQQEQQRRQQPQQLFANPEDNNNNDHISYGCEVLAFGRSNHLALGVQGGKNCEQRTGLASSFSSSDSSTTYRPHRVQEFAQDRVGRQGSAVAIAAAAHHTLVATRQGHLYAYGVGTGGRLGLGDNERHCPTPTRVAGSLEKRRVVAIAAAENHSLCVTSDGAVYAFGSNRFGQLGYSNTTDDSRCCSPRRVDDLWKKHILCVSVAAGEKHSVALTQKGEVYVWGCNASGQLGINHRSNSGAAQRVQRVDALWSKDKTRVCFQVAASCQSTLVLAKPSPGGLPVNQVYAWGHGNHVPSKVHFFNPDESRQPTKNDDVFQAAGTGARRSINPVAIASARHHSAAISSDGRVYTWGFHADSLGGAGSSSKAQKVAAKHSISRPQLVTAMLPEEGGGFAVAISASENHTAVVTNDGSLFTWGESDGKGLMGHEGVRWQPSPKRVGGVSRAVGVSAAKEHTVLLMGASFPCPASVSNSSSQMSLEQLTAREIAKHVDLFNVLPVLMTAERTNCQFLIEHCKEFIRLNIDGVLNVGQKSSMELFLKEQVASGLLLLDEDPRDRRERPLVLNIALASYRGRKGFLESETIPSNPLDWILTCQKLMKKDDSLSSLLHRLRKESKARPVVATNPKLFHRRASPSAGSISETYNENGGKLRSGSIASGPDGDRKMSSSERCIFLTTNMDLSTRELVQTKYDCLTREVRGLKKRLSQIASLEALIDPDKPNGSAFLSADQLEKISRRPKLESELCIFDRALERVEQRMRQYNLKMKTQTSNCGEDACERKAPSQQSEHCAEGKNLYVEEKMFQGKTLVSALSVEEDVVGFDSTVLRCKVCRITCPDEKSLALHVNGRKHRNRVAQEAEEEKQRAANSMMEQLHRQQMQEMSKDAESRRAKTPAVTAWQEKKQQPMSIQSKYKLPPQDNPTKEMVEEQPLRAKSLHAIMEEEVNKSRVQNSANKPLHVTSRFLQLPPGSPPPLKSPPWGGMAVVKPIVATNLSEFPGASSATKVSAWVQTSPKASATLQLPPGSTPPLKSSQWAAKPVRGSPASTAPLMVASPTTLEVKTAKVLPSFGDFLQKLPATPVKTRSGTSSAPWYSPPVLPARPVMASSLAESSKQTSQLVWSSSPAPKVGLVNPVCSTKSTPMLSFQSIQKQEEDFKSMQDQSYTDNGKWFIERRERAGSLVAIQDEATKQREEQLFIEEQKRIEEQIRREVALKKKKEMKKQRQQAKKAKQNQDRCKGDKNKEQAVTNRNTEEMSNLHQSSGRHSNSTGGMRTRTAATIVDERATNQVAICRQTL